MSSFLFIRGSDGRTLLTQGSMTNTAPVPVAPSQVGSFAAGTPSTTVIPVTYTAATGTAPITYAGQHRVYGTSTWVQNAGTFSATGGTFTGLSASNSYNLRIVASNAAGSSTTDLMTGVSTANPPAVAPSQVGSLAASIPGTTTIPVTYTAATGTAPINYAGWTRVHGTSTWVQNAGTFGVTGGTFTGLSASTSYDLRIVASNTAGSSTTDLTTGISTANPPAVAPSQVSSLTAGTPGTTTIPVSYTAATGTTPIAYVGWTRLHAGDAWVQNAGTFSTTGGTFTGLSASTSYDLRIVASNTAGSSTTDLTTGVSTASPPAVAPSQVGSLTAGTPTNYTVPVIYTAASGTGPITYAGRHALQGSTSFTPNNGVFSDSSGTFIGLAAGTAYDLQVVATNSVGSTVSTLLNISTTAAPVVPATPSVAATRFDIILSQSAVAPGATASGNLYPCSGIWGGGTVTLTRASGATVSVTLPSSGSAAVPFSFTAGAAGEEVLTATNTAGLRNPAPALLTVFAATSGTAATLSLGTLPSNVRAQRTFQQCTWSGTPAGFSGINGATFNKGWGRIKVPFASAASAIFARATDADSAGAAASGGGTVISNVVQVHGPVAANSTAALLLPASDYCVWWDLATDATFTNPVRVPVPFFIRDLVVYVTRSQENMLFGSFAYQAATGSTDWCSYTKTTGIGAQNTQYGVFETNNGAWLRCDGVQSYGQYGQVYGGVGAQETGRLFFTRKGTGAGILGLVPAGGNMDDFWAEDGSPCSTLGALLAECDGEARYLGFESNGWSGTYATESQAEYRKVYQAIPGRMMTLYPSLAVVSGKSASGYFGSDGSRATGYTRQNAMVRELEQINPCVVAAEAGADWNEYGPSSHASRASAIRYTRAIVRSLLLAEGTHAGGFGRGFADRYARFGTAGSMVAGSGLITVPFTLPAGATALVAKQWQNGTSKASDWVYTTPAAAKLAQLVTVYQGANGTQDSGAAVVPVSGVTIDNTAGTLNIAVPTSTVGPVTVQLMADFGRSTAANGFSGGIDTSSWVGLFDDRDLGDGCGYGPGARSQLDIAVTAPVRMSQPFTLSNWGSASSVVLAKRGVWFKKGDVPTGSVPVLDKGTAQFYAVSRFADGSLKRARLLLRDDPLVAGASRTYTMTAASGTLPTGGTAANGAAGLTAALAGTDIKATFSNVKDASGATYNGGTLTASLNTHAGTSTRWTLLTTGTVADVWQGWGMASGTAVDAHAKVNWFVTRYKNADGTTAGLRVMVEPALDWWSVAGATALTYDAALMNGSTQVLAWPAVAHHYRSRWVMSVGGTGNDAGEAPWITGTKPTLALAFDKAYAVACGVTPPLNTTATPNPIATPAYVPCGNMDHRAGLDATGEYPGRGIVTLYDATAFQRQDAQSWATMRVEALAGLGVPYHYRSNRQRTRSGEAADTASTVIPLLMRPKATSYSDFTAQGMPIAVDAYAGSGSPSSAQDGYVAPAGGTGVWQGSIDSSHAVSYCYFAALVTGDEWYVEAQLDLATNLAHQGIFGYHNNVTLLNATNAQGVAKGASTALWTGLLGQYMQDNIRSMGWSQLILGHAFSLLPDDHVASGYGKALVAHNGDFIGGSLDILPDDALLSGFYGPENNYRPVSPWMLAFISYGAYAAYRALDDARWKRLGDQTSTWHTRLAALGRFYGFDQYRVADRPQAANWSSTNKLYPAEQQGLVDFPVTLDSSGRVTLPPIGYNALNQCPPPFAEGDRVWFWSMDIDGHASPIPNGTTEGQVLYVKNLTNPQIKHDGSNPPSFGFSTTLGGAAISFPASQPSGSFALVWAQSTSATPSTIGTSTLYDYPYLLNWVNYIAIGCGVINVARWGTNMAVTDSMLAATNAFINPARPATYAPFDMVAT